MNGCRGSTVFSHQSISRFIVLPVHLSQVICFVAVFLGQMSEVEMKNADRLSC